MTFSLKATLKELTLPSSFFSVKAEKATKPPKKSTKPDLVDFPSEIELILKLSLKDKKNELVNSDESIWTDKSTSGQNNKFLLEKHASDEMSPDPVQEMLICKNVKNETWYENSIDLKYIYKTEYEIDLKTGNEENLLMSGLESFYDASFHFKVFYNELGKKKSKAAQMLLASADLLSSKLYETGGYIEEDVKFSFKNAKVELIDCGSLVLSFCITPDANVKKILRNPTLLVIKPFFLSQIRLPYYFQQHLKSVKEAHLKRTKGKDIENGTELPLTDIHTVLELEHKEQCWSWALDKCTMVLTCDEKYKFKVARSRIILIPQGAKFVIPMAPTCTLTCKLPLNTSSPLLVKVKKLQTTFHKTSSITSSDSSDNENEVAHENNQIALHMLTPPSSFKVETVEKPFSDEWEMISISELPEDWEVTDNPWYRNVADDTLLNFSRSCIAQGMMLRADDIFQHLVFNKIKLSDQIEFNLHDKIIEQYIGFLLEHRGEITNSLEKLYILGDTLFQKSILHGFICLELKKFSEAHFVLQKLEELAGSASSMVLNAIQNLIQYLSGADFLEPSEIGEQNLAKKWSALGYSLLGLGFLNLSTAAISIKSYCSPSLLKDPFFEALVAFKRGDFRSSLEILQDMSNDWTEQKQSQYMNPSKFSMLRQTIRSINFSDDKSLFQCISKTLTDILHEDQPWNQADYYCLLSEVTFHLHKFRETVPVIGLYSTHETMYSYLIPKERRDYIFLESLCQLGLVGEGEMACQAILSSTKGNSYLWVAYHQAVLALKAKKYELAFCHLRLAIEQDFSNHKLWLLLDQVQSHLRCPGLASATKRFLVLTKP